MIEPNKYTDETIHVANWLLGRGEADKLLDVARLRMLETPLKLDEYEDESRDYLVAECLRDCLAELIDERFMDAFSECFRDQWAGCVNEIDGIGHSPTNPFGGPGYYDNASAEELILPFVGQAVQRLNLEAVAEIILEHAQQPVA